MKPIAEVTDACLRKMSSHKLFSWDNWWTHIVKNGPVPASKTYGYYKYIMARNEIKQSVNKELGRRKCAERLMCPGQNQGIYMVDEKDVAEITVDKRVRKIVSSFGISHREMMLLAQGKRISDEDRKMLERISTMVELQQNTMIGTMSKMRSLPAATKQKLLKHLGVDTK